MSNLTPDYRDADFQTMVARLKTLLANTDSFKDYDFEGANITILMELVAYVGDLNSYFTNKLAQNIHTETANIYEVVHSLVRQQGHNPTGYIGSELTMTIRVYKYAANNPILYWNVNDQLYIPQWFKIDSGLVDEVNGENIYYTLTSSATHQILDTDDARGYAEFDITVRQGEPLSEPLTYTGQDIISNQIVLPFSNYDMSTYPYSSSPQSIVVTVGDNETAWVRINDFFDDISGLVEENNAYMFSYDKYGRYNINFSNTRNIPVITDPINVYLITTLGSVGNIVAGTFSIVLDDTTGYYVQDTGIKPETSSILGNDEPFLTNLRTDAVIPTDVYIVYNTLGSSGGSDPQDIDELKESGKAAAHSQQRNCTSADYIGSLEVRGDVTAANAWGEQEENPKTLILENYNKAYISIIPTEWSSVPPVSNNVGLKEVEIDDNFSSNNPAWLSFPTEYNLEWTDELLEYIEPRKMLGIYEYMVAPELVYFRLDFGLKVKRTYNWTDVKETILAKLVWYFSNSQREFGELIDFREVVNYIVDPTTTSPTNDFALVRAIDSLVLRDLMTYRDVERVETMETQSDCEEFDGTWDSVTDTCSFVPGVMTIYTENRLNYFPRYDELGYVSNSTDTTYNDIQPIQLGFTQFPQLANDLCVFVNEG